MFFFRFRTDELGRPRTHRVRWAKWNPKSPPTCWAFKKEAQEKEILKGMEIGIGIFWKWDLKQKRKYVYIYICDYIYCIYTYMFFVFFFKTEIPTQIGKMSAAVFPKNFHLEHHYRPQGPRFFTNRPSQVHHNLSQFTLPAASQRTQNNPSKIEWDLPNGPRSGSCDRAIRFSGFFGVRETWVLLEISWK